jgi:uncharacterized protein YecE (DUF72 family)
MGWSYSFWVNKLYPKGTKPKAYLTEYAKHFNSVEIDATFYRIPSEDTVRSWAAQVPKGFRFAAKFPQAVSHAAGLEYDPEKLDIFLGRIAQLGDRLGPLLIQFPPYLKPDHVKLRDLLDALPPGFLYAAEFRNKAWFTEDTYALLRDKRVAYALNNTPGHPEVNTTGFTYIRWEGDRKAVNGEKGIIEADRVSETADWAKRIKRLSETGVEVYGYVSKYYSGYPVSDVEELKRLLAEGIS